MTAFHIYGEDGRVLQSNKVYSPEGYEDRLREHGYDRFLAVQSDMLANPDQQYVRLGELCSRPEMPVQCERLDVRAGTSDCAVFSQIPDGCEMIVQTGGMNVWQQRVPGVYVEFSPPVPAVYSVIFRKWPYRDFIREVKAI
jgi:hypothetical protein